MLSWLINVINSWFDYYMLFAHVCLQKNKLIDGEKKKRRVSLRLTGGSKSSSSESGTVSTSASISFNVYSPVILFVIVLESI